MAAKHSMIKFAIFFTVLLTATIVDMSRTSKVQVMALRQLPAEASILKMKLFPVNMLGGCSDYCNSNSDCGGITLCQWCWEKTDFNDHKYRSCSMLP
ncbi:PREDICTED: fruit-specific protein-like [Nicotiana attenuata]|uniref:Fruit-specific protein n=1 Tax=Nicotiana attenuata TaxID=49451 RepID=A0A1J6I9N3_NICAT|nr:PREDICTED: fruit-specific protein-like [Nicotiana attenuata]OIS95658.1 fruit-specific protein [Nicotiana attenuata]